jgi:hypothetical protein
VLLSAKGCLRRRLSVQLSTQQGIHSFIEFALIHLLIIEFALIHLLFIEFALIHFFDIHSFGSYFEQH